MLQLFSGYFPKNSFGCCHIFTWLLKLMILDVYICPWLLRDNSDSCWWNSDRMYIYVVGCLDACTVVAPWVQQGRIYMPLACKGLRFASLLLKNIEVTWAKSILFIFSWKALRRFSYSLLRDHLWDFLCWIFFFLKFNLHCLWGTELCKDLF